MVGFGYDIIFLLWFRLDVGSMNSLLGCKNCEIMGKVYFILIVN
jgi:hypothetical protein